MTPGAIRWLTWSGLGVLLAGALAAFAARLLVPATLLRFGLYADPAVAILSLALIAALVLLGAGALRRRQAARLEGALARQASALDTERRRFIQRLDHELKNPLTAIQIQLDNLQAAGGAPAPVAQTLAGVAELRAQAERLAQLTRGLRRLADLEARPLEIERVEIGELLAEMLELLPTPPRVTLDVQRAPWPIPPIEADRELLLVALRNLADNALKYSAAPVRVSARDAPGRLVVEVVDTGRGIAPDELPLVTEELYRGTNARDVEGTGLGLAMVQRIIERHGGALEVRSRPGQGTIATVLLPYDRPAPR